MSKHVPQNSSFSFSSASPDALSADTSPERDKAGSSNASVRELAANSPISWKGSSNDDDDFAAEQGALAVERRARLALCQLLYKLERTDEARPLLASLLAQMPAEPSDELDAARELDAALAPD